jgi:hypothetical protein
MLEEISKESKYNFLLNVFRREKNVGLEKNALFVLSKATSEYVMYLGDDDYIDEKYLLDVICRLNKERDIRCVLPADRAIDYDGNPLQGGRDLNVASKVYDRGFNNCLVNSWRGHQLSGVVLYKDKLLDSYNNAKVCNIYLFIYFVAYCCLNGKTWHFTDYPVSVTAAEQKDKDWNYGKDGLVSEIFDNYKKLNVSLIQRARLECKLLKEQPWRYCMYLNKKIYFVRACFNIEFGKNTSCLTKFVFPIFVLKICAGMVIRKLLRF